MADHYGVIDDELAGRPGPECVPWDHDELRDDGIEAVVSLDEGVDSYELEEAGFLHLEAFQPMIVLETERDHRQFLQIMPAVAQFIDARRRERRGTVVHCHYGCDRTGAVLGCYLVGRMGMAPFEAYQHVKTRNPRAFGISSYAEAILTFDRMIRENPSWLDSPVR